MRFVACIALGAAVGFVVAACGGSPFSAAGDAGTSGSSGGGGSGSGSSSGGGSGSGGDASSDGPTTGGDGAVTVDGGSCTFPPTRCGGMTCDGSGTQQGSLCCVAPAQTPAFGCASCSCGCATQLECSGPADCSGSKICCITQAPCGGSASHWVSTCTAVAQCSGSRLCNPSGNALVECAGAGTSCSTATSGVGVPSSTGYGVCK